MFKNNDISGLTDNEYKELKEYLKKIYDIDGVFFPLKFPTNIIIS